VKPSSGGGAGNATTTLDRLADKTAHLHPSCDQVSLGWASRCSTSACRWHGDHGRERGARARTLRSRLSVCVPARSPSMQASGGSERRADVAIYRHRGPRPRTGKATSQRRGRDRWQLPRRGTRLPI